ncbi:putative lipid II flippase FtsW [Glutamicibacter sp. JL.03c]|uniref:putative lipid II flippase FtsW n=1 Tax=Glutamicibacter sp. JL.03c TaxID=2984842 RepID=UPI0021F6F3B7|nr:putative lipid II flippase FtsW [Glutamicibacter sp. JL.03c]UYQ76371.1 putative lipid II flippase FtsW [Glutamicibacter sp. JL.03c]
MENASARMASMDYWLVVVVSVVLAIFGVLMVQSSASVEAIAKGKDGFTVALSQAMFAGIGIICMLGMQFIKPENLKKLAWLSVIAAFLLLFLVAFTPLGHTVLGNRNWIKIGPVGLQPSEFAKLALAVFAAFMLERKQHLLHEIKHLVVPVVAPVGTAIVGLVVIGKDVGTALVLLMIIASAMFLGGIRMKWLAGFGAVGLVGLAVAVMGSSNRRQRVLAWLDTDCGPSDQLCYQASMGLHAFASGGWFGVGAGQSRMKWSYVPEAQNDFIFSILGEEFGLIGVLFVLVMFILLALAMYRIALRASDLYTKVLMGCLMSWVIGQTFVNLGTVTGVLPVIGVPLPFISSGGSAMLAIMLAMGFVLSSARAQKLAFDTSLEKITPKPNNAK